MKAALILLVLYIVFKASIGISDKAVKVYRDNKAAIDACIFNPAYQGANPDDTRMLYRQCLADYKESHSG